MKSLMNQPAMKHNLREREQRKAASQDAQRRIGCLMTQQETPDPEV